MVLRNIVFIVCMAVGTVAALSSRFGALLVYLWFALFRPQEWVWIDVTSLRLSLVFGAILVVPSIFTGILPNVSHPLSIGALCFLGTALVAQVNAVRPDIGWQWIDFLARLILVSLLAATLLDTKRRFYLAVAVIAGSLGYYTAKAGVASALGGGLQYAAGLGGAYIDSNGYALAAVMVMPLLIAAAQNVPIHSPFRKIIRTGLYLSVPLTGLTVVSTFSRAGFLALCASLLVFVALQKRRVLMLLLLAVAVAVAAPFVPIPQGYFDRIESIRTYETTEENSAMSRLHFWRVAIDMAAANPLGVGLRNFDFAYDQYDFLDGRYGRNRAVHNSSFQVLAETGYLGATVWIVLFGMAFRVGFRIRRRARDAVLAETDRRFLLSMSNALMVSMTGFIVGGSFIALALNDLTWLTFSLLAALDRLSARMVSAEVQAVPAQASARMSAS